MNKKCSKCERPYYAKGFCQNHYGLSLYHVKKNIPINKERKSLASKVYYLKHKDTVLENQKIRRSKDVESWKSYHREATKKHRELLKSLGIDERDRDLYGGNKKKVYDRDNYTCQDCGLTNKQSIKLWKVNLSVHHIDGSGYGVNKDKKNNDMTNLVTLCLLCHGKEENRIASGKKPRSLISYKE